MTEQLAESSHESSPEELSRAQIRAQVLVQRTIRVGWISVLFSALFLYLSQAVGADATGSGNFLWAIFLMAARLCGIASFAIGGVAIYNRRWTAGMLMLLFSVWLPIIAFFVHGTI